MSAPYALSRRSRTFVWIFSAGMVVTAGLGFGFKLIEFVYVATTRGQDALYSFLIPVLNYLMVAAGFACLFLRAYAQGMFANPEAAGLRMLELQREMDRPVAASPVGVSQPAAQKEGRA